MLSEVQEGQIKVVVVVVVVVVIVIVVVVVVVLLIHFTSCSLPPPIILQSCTHLPPSPFSRFTHTHPGYPLTLALQFLVRPDASSPSEARQDSPARTTYPTYRQQLLDSPCSSYSRPT